MCAMEELKEFNEHTFLDIFLGQPSLQWLPTSTHHRIRHTHTETPGLSNPYGK